MLISNTNKWIEQCGEAHHEGRVDGGQVGEGEVLEDADEPHLPTSFLGVYWTFLKLNET